MKNDIRIAIIQPKPHSAYDDPQNLGHALELLRRLRGEKLDAICFPETFPLMGEEELAQAAQRADSYLIAGIGDLDGDKFFNAAVLFDRQGRLLARQRKRHLSREERELWGFSPGDGFHRVIPTDFGRLALAVGIDFWGSPLAVREMVEQSPDVVFNPSVFTNFREQWRIGAMSRGFEMFVPVVGVNVASYNVKIGDKRIRRQGGGSFVLQPPKMLDKGDFTRWFRSAKSSSNWLQFQLDELEQFRIVDVNLSTARNLRREFRSRLGFDI